MNILLEEIITYRSTNLGKITIFSGENLLEAWSEVAIGTQTVLGAESLEVGIHGWGSINLR